MRKRRWLIFVMAFSLMCGPVSAHAGTDCSAVEGIPEAECNVLMNLYNNTNGSGWQNNGNWAVTNAPCDWDGVYCDGGHVSALVMFSNKMDGPFPSDLHLLPNLINLTLKNNQLTGAIPANLGTLSDLEELRLNGNELSGSVPSALGNLSNLEFLRLGDNSGLSGALPLSLKNLTKLEVLGFSNTGLCDPSESDSDFEDWLDDVETVESSGNMCTPPATTTTTLTAVTTTSSPVTTTTSSPVTTTASSPTTTSSTTIPPNYPPTDISLSSTDVDENRPSGTELGTLTTDDPNNPDDSHTYALVAGDGDDDNGEFVLTNNLLSTAATFDYEAKNTYTIRVRTTDSGDLRSEKSFTITINDVNEKPSDMRLTRVTIPENTAPGVTVGRFSVTDPDEGDTHTYHLVVGSRGWQDNSSFRISGDYLVITESPDYENKDSYTINLRCNDSGGGSCFRTFVITVSDVNEDPTDIVLSNRWIRENQPAETEIGFLTATDPDAGDTHTYALVPGEGSDDNGSFSIYGNRLRTAEVFDYETMPHKYNIRVRASDNKGGAREESFVIVVGDVNDPPSEIILGNDSVPERMPVGTMVGVLTTEDPDDPDGKDSYTYELTDECPGNASFTIADDTLETSAVLDYGVNDQHTVCVSAADADGEKIVREFGISVIPHEAPVLSSYEAALTPAEENEAENSGNSIPEILESGPVLLADGSFPIGIAVTAVDNTDGKWQYSADRGTEWKDFTRITGQTADISEVARLLPVAYTHRIRFVPDLPVTGDITASLTFRAWDMSQGISGETRDTTVSGGRSAFSGETAEASVSVVFSEEIVEVGITGTIRNFRGEPVPWAGVVTLLNGDVTNRDVSQDGDYELHTGRYVRHRVYTFEIWAPAPTHESPVCHNDFTEDIAFTEDADIVRNVVLGQSGMLCGQVCVGDTGIPVAGAVVTAYSADQNWWNGTLTDENGIWYFQNVPEASDYLVTVRAEGYGTLARTGISAGESLSLRARPVLSLTGCVRDEAGTGLRSALVEVRSESPDFSDSLLTNGDGCYEISSLPTSEIYTVTAKKVGYLPQSQTWKRAGDQADFVLTRGGSISGTITDSTGQPPPDGVQVVVMAFEKGQKGCVSKAVADDSGHFSVSGLVPGTSYLLRFVAVGSDLAEPSQWAGPGGPGTDFGEAVPLTPAQSVNLRFDGSWEG